MHAGGYRVKFSIPAFQLHHFFKFDVIKLDNEYDKSILNYIILLKMSKLEHE